MKTQINEIKRMQELAGINKNSIKVPIPQLNISPIKQKLQKIGLGTIVTLSHPKTRELIPGRFRVVGTSGKDGFEVQQIKSDGSYGKTYVYPSDSVTVYEP